MTLPAITPAGGLSEAPAFWESGTACVAGGQILNIIDSCSQPVRPNKYSNEGAAVPTNLSDVFIKATACNFDNNENDVPGNNGCGIGCPGSVGPGPGLGEGLFHETLKATREDASPSACAFLSSSASKDFANDCDNNDSDVPGNIGFGCNGFPGSVGPGPGDGDDGLHETFKATREDASSSACASLSRFMQVCASPTELDSREAFAPYVAQLISDTCEELEHAFETGVSLESTFIDVYNSVSSSPAAQNNSHIIDIDSDAEAACLGSPLFSFPSTSASSLPLPPSSCGALHSSSSVSSCLPSASSLPSPVAGFPGFSPPPFSSPSTLSPKLAASASLVASQKLPESAQQSNGGSSCIVLGSSIMIGEASDAGEALNPCPGKERKNEHVNSCKAAPGLDRGACSPDAMEVAGVADSTSVFTSNHLDSDEIDFELDAEADASPIACPDESEHEFPEHFFEDQAHAVTHIHVSEGFSVKASLLTKNVPGYGNSECSDSSFPSFGKVRTTKLGPGFRDETISPHAVRKEIPMKNRSNRLPIECYDDVVVSGGGGRSSSHNITIDLDQEEQLVIEEVGTFKKTRAQEFRNQACSSKYIARHGIPKTRIDSRVRSLSSGPILSVGRSGQPHFCVDNSNDNNVEPSETCEF